MKCPTKNCKGEIRQEVVLEGTLFSRRKKIINYCTLCGFENVHSFKIKEEEYQKLQEKA